MLELKLLLPARWLWSTLRAFSAESEGLIVPYGALTSSGDRQEEVLPRRVSSSRLIGKEVKK